MKAVRWPSTWSVPDCASSSITKMHVFFHCGLFEDGLDHTTRPMTTLHFAVHAFTPSSSAISPTVHSSTAHI